MGTPKLAVTIFRDEDKGDVIKLLEDHKFTFKGKEYVVPEGYESDGMSIPRFFWRLICPQIDATSLIPSVEHDFLYDEKAGTRKEIDQFYENKKDKPFASGFCFEKLFYVHRITLSVIVISL